MCSIEFEGCFMENIVRLNKGSKLELKERLNFLTVYSEALQAPIHVFKVNSNLKNNFKNIDTKIRMIGGNYI